MIYSLQSIRFFLALLIFHIHYFTPQIKQFGTFPVVFFFILSGFLLSLGYADKVTQASFCYRRFVIKRFSKIYPLNVVGLLLWLTISLVMDIHTGEISVFRYLKLFPNFLLVQSWFPVESVYFSGNGPCWFLSDILFCYLMFPLLIRIRKSYFHYIWLIIALVCYFLAVIMMPNDYVKAIIYINPLFRMVDFIIGIELSFVYKALSVSNLGNSSFPKSSMQELLVVAIAVVFLLLYPYVPQRFSYVSFYWLPSLLIVIILSLHATNGGLISKALSTKSLCYLGSLSFPFYVFHIIIISGYRHALNLVGLYIPEIVGAVICVVLIILVSHYYIKLFEPFIIKLVSSTISHVS